MLNILKFFTMTFFCVSVYIQQHTYTHRLYFAVTRGYTYIRSVGSSRSLNTNQAFLSLKRPNGAMFATFGSHEIVINVFI